MTQTQIANRLKGSLQGRSYVGSLTPYTVKSIEKGRSNYPVSNLIAYCEDMNLRLAMFDLVTEDCFYPTSVLEVHKVLGLLMGRYNVDYKLVYRKTAIHYTVPKSFDDSSKAPLSIKTFLAVCDVIHCDLRFESD